MLRVIGEIQPDWIVGENVFGLINWSGGLVFDQVQANLETSGYEIMPFILPACAVGALHRRDRVWIIAHSGSDGYELRGFGESQQPQGKSKINQDKRERIRDDFGGNGKPRLTPNAAGSSCSHEGSNERSESQEIQKTGFNGNHSKQWKSWPTESAVSGMDDGIPNRVDRIKGLGNAIVPQVAFEIFKAIALVATPER